MPINVGDLEATLGLNSGDFEKGLTKAQKKMRDTGRVAQQAGGALTKGVTLPLIALGALSAKAAIEFESSFTGIRKTVSATEEQFSELSDGMRELAKTIPVNVNELNKIGEAAGQLGIKTENILEFTETIAQLGVTTNLTTEEAATGFARIANVMGTAQDEFDNMGSAVVALGNNLATTEKEIVNMSLNMAGAANIAGFAESEVLAFAGAMSSVGIEASLGGTQFGILTKEIQRFTSTGGKELDLIARVSGKTSDAFIGDWEKAPAQALQSFIDGLADAKAGGEDVSAIVRELGFDQGRMTRVVLGLAGANEVLADALDISAEAWEENAALTREAELRFGTTESKMQILQNTVNDVGIELGDTLIPALVDAIDAAKPLINLVGDAAEAFSDMSPEAQKLAIGIAAVTAAAGPALFIGGKLAQSYVVLTGAIKASTLATSTNSKTTVLNTASKAKAAAAIGALSAVAVIAVDDLANMATTMEEENERSERIIKSHGIMADVFDGWGRSLLGSDRKLFGLSVGLEKYDKKAEDSTEATDDQLKAIVEAGKGSEDFADVLNGDLTPALDDTATALAELSGLTSEYFDETEQAAGISRDLADAQREVDEQTIENKKLLEEYNDVVAEFGEESDEATLALGRLKDGEDAAADATNTLKQKTGEVNKILEGEAAQAGLTKDGLNELIEETDNWNDLSLGEKKALINVVGVERLERANKAIRTFNQSGSFRFDGKVQAPPTPRADGGPVGPEKTFLVGERGPELFVPKTQGTIIPNDKMGAAGGDKFTFNFNGPVNNRQEVMQAVKQAVNEMTRNGRLQRRPN